MKRQHCSKHAPRWLHFEPKMYPKSSFFFAKYSGGVIVALYKESSLAKVIRASIHTTDYGAFGNTPNQQLIQSYRFLARLATDRMPDCRMCFWN